MAAHICGILLAAGASKRFGSDKLMHTLAGTTPVAVAALANLRSAIPHVIAVVRPGDIEWPLGRTRFQSVQQSPGAWPITFVWATGGVGYGVGDGGAG